MVEPREDGGCLSRDDCVAVEAVLPHRVEAGQVEQRPLSILVRRPVHEEGLLVAYLPDTGGQLEVTLPTLRHLRHS